MSQSLSILGGWCGKWENFYTCNVESFEEGEIYNVVRSKTVLIP